jgi:hypothetical protein
MKLLLKLGTSIALYISAAPALADDMKKDSMTAKPTPKSSPRSPKSARTNIPCMA